MAFPRAYLRFIRNFLTSLFLASITLFIISSHSYRNSSFSLSLPFNFLNFTNEDTLSPSSFLLGSPVKNNQTAEVGIDDEKLLSITSENDNMLKPIGSGIVIETPKKLHLPSDKSKIRKYNYILLTNSYSELSSDKVRENPKENDEELVSRNDNGTKATTNRNKGNEAKGNVYNFNKWDIENLRSKNGPPTHEIHAIASPTTSHAIASNISALYSADKSLKYRYEEIVDKKRKSKILWKNDNNCKDYKVHFAKRGSLPVCALASYPGSGNTWTRRLLEYASGIFTGSIYSDQQLFVYGYYGELENWAQGTTIAQKTHDCGPSHIQDFNRSVILLLRNPYRAILSFHNYLFAGHTGFAPIMNYRRKDWSLFVHLQAKSWLELAVNWTTMADTKDLTVLHYETLREDPVPSLVRALEGRSLVWDPKRMDCLQRAHSYKTFKRKEEFVPENLEIFSAMDRDKIDRAIRYVDYLLQKKGKEPLPLHLYEFYNGTDSTGMTRIPCKTLESTAECDDRIDQLNNVRKNKRGEDFDEERTKRRRRD